VKDSAGKAFGLFALDTNDDLLHVASGLWAGISALVGRRAARFYLIVFGSLYLSDGLLGLVTGSGYLDLGIVKDGVLDLPLSQKIPLNLPHISAGSFAIFSGIWFGDEAR